MFMVSAAYGRVGRGVIGWGFGSGVSDLSLSVTRLSPYRISLHTLPTSQHITMEGITKLIHPLGQC